MEFECIECGNMFKQDKGDAVCECGGKGKWKLSRHASVSFKGDGFTRTIG